MLTMSNQPSMLSQHEYFLKLKPEEQLTHFNDIIWSYYAQEKRILPWRENISPYGVVVSELMLQQTQVDRVKFKYPSFIECFPNFAALAKAPFSEVLRLWKGLGYNRRALRLQQLAARVVDEFDCVLPQEVATLETFSGIGKATARSICAFAFNAPTVFIETNIRTVFLYFFFNHDEALVSDRAIEELLAKTVPQGQGREWYYALMDFGSMLKKQVGNLNHKSVHYQKQSKFLGSKRQLRGKVLQSLLEHGLLSDKSLQELFIHELHPVEVVVAELFKEGLIKKTDGKYHL